MGYYITFGCIIGVLFEMEALMLKFVRVWPLLAALLILFFGTVFVPIMTGAKVEFRSFVESLPVAVLVYLVVKFCLDRVYSQPGSDKPLLEKYISERLSVYLYSALILIIVVVSVLTFLR